MNYSETPRIVSNRAPMQISKSFEFDAAHRLWTVPDCHPCKALHGHRYSVEVIIRDENFRYLDKSMVLDYRELSKIVKDCIIQICDHSILISNRDNALVSLASANPEIFSKCAIINALETTAENLARVFQNVIACNLHLHDANLGSLQLSVVVSETPSTRAETNAWLIRDFDFSFFKIDSIVSNVENEKTELVSMRS